MSLCFKNVLEICWFGAGRAYITNWISFIPQVRGVPAAVASWR